MPAVVLALIATSWVLGVVFFGPPLVSVPDYHPYSRTHVANDMKQLSLAILNFESGRQHFPPAYKTDASGCPAHSWRILVLPLLECEHGKGIYRQYRMDQPWDSPHNLSVANQLKEPLFGDETDPTLATYKLVSGAGTLFGADTKTKFDETMQLSEQIAVVEDVASPVLWTKPEDLTPAQVVKIFDANKNPDGLYKQFGNQWSGTYTRKSWVAMMDGSVQDAYPLADSTQLLPFCLQDQRPSGSVSDLKRGDVATVERHGSDNAAIGFPTGLFLLVLMILPSIGGRWGDFCEVFGLAFSYTFLASVACFLTTLMFRLS